MSHDPKPEHPHNRKKRTRPEQRRRNPNWGGGRLGADAPRGNMNALKPCPERVTSAYEGTAAERTQMIRAGTLLRR